MHIIKALLAVAALVLAGCVAISGSGTATPFIITSTLPPTIVPSATLTPIPPTPSPTTTPVDGMTTTQVNVRTTPSTTGTQLAILPPFAKVAIVGQDPDSHWYQILYPQGPNGTGWVTAQYINVITGKDRIPIVGGLPTETAAPTGTPGASSSGVVMQQVNVRKGPGTQFDALGTLNPKEVVALTGKDPSGAWLQIQYDGAPVGAGWVAATYIQATGAAQIPVIGASNTAAPAGTPAAAQPASTATPGVALQDGDSAQAPAADVALSASGTRTLIYSSDLSAPAGDSADWVKFSSDGSQVLISLSCSGSGQLTAELLHGDGSIAGPGCGQTRLDAISAGQPYLIHVSLAASEGTAVYMRYSLHVESAG